MFPVGDSVRVCACLCGDILPSVMAYFTVCNVRYCLASSVLHDFCTTQVWRQSILGHIWEIHSVLKCISNPSSFCIQLLHSIMQQYFAYSELGTLCIEIQLSSLNQINELIYALLKGNLQCYITTQKPDLHGKTSLLTALIFSPFKFAKLKCLW